MVNLQYLIIWILLKLLTCGRILEEMKIILENKPIERISARTNLITSVGLAEKWAAYGSLKLKKKEHQASFINSITDSVKVIVQLKW